MRDAAGNNPARILHEYEEFNPGAPNERSAGPIVAALFSPDGKRAWAVQSSGKIWQWNTADWTSAGVYQTEPGASSAALSPNGKVIAIANQDGAVRFYTADTGRLQLVLASAPDSNSALTVAGDGRYDVGLPSDLALAAYRVGRETISVDRLPGSRRVQGLLSQFLKENAAAVAKVSSADRP